MLKWALIFAVISLIAGVLGFTGVAAGAAGIAKFLFVVFLVLFVAVLLIGLLGARAVTRKKHSSTSPASGWGPVSLKNNHPSLPSFPEGLRKAKGDPP
jgi:uncharacterized membrane protein YtjA (UPF0391 family)